MHLTNKRLTPNKRRVYEAVLNERPRRLIEKIRYLFFKKVFLALKLCSG